MFNLIEELWKSQHYMPKNCLLYEIPNTFCINQGRITWYFTSQREPGRILKKKQENTTIQSLSDYFKVDKKITHKNPIAIYSKQRTDLQVKYLNHEEMIAIVTDIKAYPGLYDGIIIMDYNSNDYLVYKKRNYIEKIRQVQLFTDQAPQSVNIYLEERIKRAVQQIEDQLSITLQLRSFTLYMGLNLTNNQICIYWNTYYQAKNKPIRMKLVPSKIFLYNQKLCTNSNSYLYLDDIDKENEVARKEKIQTKSQCSSCRKLMIDSFSFEVFETKLWQIRMKRGLHLINDQHLITKQGLIKPETIKVGFVKICQECYDVFLGLITKYPPKARSKASISIHQESLPIQQLQKVESIKKQEKPQSFPQPTLAPLPPKQIKKQIFEDFDDLLNALEPNLHFSNPNQEQSKQQYDSATPYESESLNQKSTNCFDISETKRISKPYLNKTKRISIQSIPQKRSMSAKANKSTNINLLIDMDSLLNDYLL